MTGVSAALKDIGLRTSTSGILYPHFSAAIRDPIIRDEASTCLSKVFAEDASLYIIKAGLIEGSPQTSHPYLCSTNHSVVSLRVICSSTVGFDSNSCIGTLYGRRGSSHASHSNVGAVRSTA